MTDKSDMMNEYFDFVIQPGENKLYFRLNGLNTIVKGPWTFEIQADTREAPASTAQAQ